MAESHFDKAKKIINILKEDKSTCYVCSYCHKPFDGASEETQRKIADVLKEGITESANICQDCLTKDTIIG